MSFHVELGAQRLGSYSLGSVAPALWQLTFKRRPGFVLGVHSVQGKSVLKEFRMKEFKA